MDSVSLGDAGSRNVVIILTLASLPVGTWVSVQSRRHQFGKPQGWSTVLFNARKTIHKETLLKTSCLFVNRSCASADSVVLQTACAERVALSEVAGFKSQSKPTNALFGRSVSEGVGNDVAL